MSFDYLRVYKPPEKVCLFCDPISKDVFHQHNFLSFLPFLQVSLQASGTFKSSRDVTSTSGKLTLTTPFKPVNSLAISMAYDDDAQHYGLNGKMTLGDKSQQISSSLSLSKPLSLRNLQMTWEAETPFQVNTFLFSSQAQLNHRSLLS